MEYQILSEIEDLELIAQIEKLMFEWCGATFYNCRYDKIFTIADIVFNENEMISFRAISKCGTIEDWTNLRDIEYNVKGGQYLNIQKP